MSDTRPFDPALFAADAIDAKTRATNAQLLALMTGLPDWWVVGAAATRAERRRGDGPFPPPIKSNRARTLYIRARDGYEIPLRVISPTRPRGIYLHLHAGGWVLGGADLQDPLLERIADSTGLACVSVEYRLAPEHPYPAAPDDCETAALWLISNGRSELGTDVLTIGGESAGGHLSAVTLLRLRDRHGFSACRGANLVYGVFDLSMTPSQRLFGETRLVLRTSDMQQFYQAFLPAVTERRDPDISPLYAQLHGLCPALFTVGTRDALLDDSLFMHARWVAAGNAAELAIYSGGAHGFTLFPNELGETAVARMEAFLNGVLD